MGAINLRQKNGQSAVELVAGLLILIPLLLFLVDIGALVLGNFINDDLCTQAARAAANIPVPNTAQILNASLSASGNPPSTSSIAFLKSLGVSNFAVPLTQAQAQALQIQTIAAGKNAAVTAASTVLGKKAQGTGIIQKIELMDPTQTPPVPGNTVDFNEGSPGYVLVATRITVNLPVPIPFMGDTACQFVSRATLPLTTLNPTFQQLNKPQSQLSGL